MARSIRPRAAGATAPASMFYKRRETCRCTHIISYGFMAHAGETERHVSADSSGGPQRKNGDERVCVIERTSHLAHVVCGIAEFDDARDSKLPVGRK